MSKSRKDMSRGEIRRRRQLREQQERVDSKDDRRYLPAEFGFEAFLYKRKKESIFLVIIVIGVFAVLSLGPDRKAMDELRDSVDEMLSWQSMEWDVKHPHGYKVIAFTDKNIVMTSYDTMPDELKINWKKISVARIQMDQMRQTTEKIEVKIDNISYPPANISGASVVATISRNIGATASLGQYGDLNLFVKIIHDDGSNLFCLFGLNGP